MTMTSVIALQTGPDSFAFQKTLISLKNIQAVMFQEIVLCVTINVNECTNQKFLKFADKYVLYHKSYLSM